MSHKFAITLTGNTWDELRASAAIIAGTAVSGGALIATTINQAVTAGLAATDDSGDEDNAPVNTNAPAVDSVGLPWDERIHAKSKETNADGKWKRRRKTPDEVVTAVEAELRARMAQPMTQAVTGVHQHSVSDPSHAGRVNDPSHAGSITGVHQHSVYDPAQIAAQQAGMHQMQQPVAQQPQMTQVYDPAQIAAAVQQQQPVQQPQMQQQPVQQFVQQQPQQLQAIDFDRLMRNIGHGFNNNPATGLPWVDNNVLVRICAQVGVNNIGEIAPHRDKIDAVHAILVNEQRFPNVA